MKNKAHYQTLEHRRVALLFKAMVASGARPSVLDFGCGNGKYLRLIRDLGCSVVGVDVNPGYVASLREEGFDVLSPDALFAEDGSFDVVLLSHVIEHIAPAELNELMLKLIRLTRKGGTMIIVTPVLGERFYHDLTHVRPYYPQSIRHAFGLDGALISFGSVNAIELIDIYFFRDPFKTRTWRSFYVGRGYERLFTRMLNSALDWIWLVSGGRVGALASWLGVYRVK